MNHKICCQTIKILTKNGAPPSIKYKFSFIKNGAPPPSIKYKISFIMVTTILTDTAFYNQPFPLTQRKIFYGIKKCLGSRFGSVGFGIFGFMDPEPQKYADPLIWIQGAKFLLCLNNSVNFKEIIWILMWIFFPVRIQDPDPDPYQN